MEFNKNELQVMILCLESKLHRVVRDREIHSLEDDTEKDIQSALNKTRTMLRNYDIC